MQAIVYERYGPPDVLRLEDVEKPRPRHNELVVRVRATTVNRTDTAFRAGTPFASRLASGVVRPRKRILGAEYSGEVDEVGSDVTAFRPGDHVFGLNPWRFGTHAQFVAVPADGPLAEKPARLPFEEAAAVCDGGLLALLNLRRGGLRSGQHVLIYGASGSIGTASVQLAKWIGARVTAVCNTKNVDLVRGLGADDVIDYTAEDFTRRPERYDAIFDAVGKLTVRRHARLLRPGGAFMPTDGLENVLFVFWPLRYHGRRATMALPPRFRADDVRLLKRLIDAGRYRPVIDRSYPLDQAAEAHRYVETQQKTGNVVLLVP